MLKYRKSIRSTSRLRNRRGAAAVEFALIANILFTLIFAAVEFTRLNMIRNLTQDAAYSAARYSMVPGATASEATARANEILAYLDTQGATVSINNGLGITTDSDEVVVEVSVPVGDNAFLLASILTEQTIVARATMRTERYDGYYSAD